MESAPSIIERKNSSISSLIMNTQGTLDDVDSIINDNSSLDTSNQKLYDKLDDLILKRRNEGREAITAQILYDLGRFIIFKFFRRLPDFPVHKYYNNGL